MKIEKHFFGQSETNERVDLYTLTNSNGIVVKITNFGGRITELYTPDKTGKLGNIVLGFDNLKQYEQKNPYFGATIGRVANRIASGHFTIDHKIFHTPINNGPNTLHGGLIGFDRRVWEVEEKTENGLNSLRFHYFSPDGEEGFPGNLQAYCYFSLLDNNELRMDFVATVDLPTIVNMTNHSYFNLKGPGVGTILDHRLTIYADKYTPRDENLIPTGEIAPVAGTPGDFTKPHLVGERIGELPHGYDHNFVLNSREKQMKRAARVEEDTTGRVLEVATTQPGVQFYSGNFLDGTLVGIGGAYPRHAALCLETQHYPDSIHHPNFPTTILRPGQEYRETAVYRFSTM